MCTAQDWSVSQCFVLLFLLLTSELLVHKQGSNSRRQWHWAQCPVANLAHTKIVTTQAAGIQSSGWEAAVSGQFLYAGITLRENLLLKHLFIGKVLSICFSVRVQGIRGDMALCQWFLTRVLQYPGVPRIPLQGAVGCHIALVGVQI